VRCVALIMAGDSGSLQGEVRHSGNSRYLHWKLRVLSEIWQGLGLLGAGPSSIVVSLSRVIFGARLWVGVCV